MNDTQAQILTAAFQVIQRYGITRSTMEDYAREAGVSRRTLYSYYDGKEALLRAIIRKWSAERVETLKEEGSAADTLSDKIDVIFQVLAIEPRESIDQAPDGAELMYGIHEVAQNELEESYVAFEQVLAELLDPYREDITGAGMTVEGLAAYLRSATKSMQKTAKDVEEMKHLLVTLKAMLMASLK